jgi:hypothetical protein
MSLSVVRSGKDYVMNQVGHLYRLLPFEIIIENMNGLIGTFNLFQPVLVVIGKGEEDSVRKTLIDQAVMMIKDEGVFQPMMGIDAFVHDSFVPFALAAKPEIKLCM